MSACFNPFSPLRRFLVFQAQLRLGVAAVVLVLAALVVFPASVGAAGEPLVVEDQRGKKIEFNAPVERIITIPMPMASVVMTLDGGSKRLVGMHPSSLKSIEEGLLKRIFPESLSIRADVTRGGTFTPNLESILELHPDVVIQWTQPADLIESLESAGIKVVGLINSPKTQAINEKNLAIVGELLGRRERTGALMDRFHSVMDRIESVTAAIPAKERPRTLYFRSVRDGGMRPAGRKVYQDFWMTLAGGQNVAGGSFEGLETAVNVEQILAWNPEIIFVGAFDNGTPADFMDNPALAEIEAVRNRRVYKLPHGGYRWDPGSHESFLTWMWAAMLTQPKRFDFDLRQAMVDGYRFLYHYNLSEAEIDEILQMKDNGSMAEYDRFTGKR